jgi:glycosyltransferase involved in cell wall biosynthesis
VIPNGIQLDRFSVPDTETRSRQRRALGIADGVIVVGSVGRLNWAKDFPMLVRAFGRARDLAGVNAQLVIAGEGGERGAIESAILESRLSNAVMLLGDRSDVADLLKAMDVFACSSKTEGYSIALLEACASGLPIVATNVGGNSEIVQNGITGLIAPHNTEEELANALAQLLGNAAIRSEFAFAAHAWSIQHASVDAMVDAYLTAYGR